MATAAVSPTAPSGPAAVTARSTSHTKPATTATRSPAMAARPRAPLKNPNSLVSHGLYVVDPESERFHRREEELQSDELVRHEHFLGQVREIGQWQAVPGPGFGER